MPRLKKKTTTTKKNFCMWFRKLLVKMRKTITHYGFQKQGITKSECIEKLTSASSVIPHK